jgi:hypothetical protein
MKRFRQGDIRSVKRHSREVSAAAQGADVLTWSGQFVARSAGTVPLVRIHCTPPASQRDWQCPENLSVRLLASLSIKA